MEMGEISIMNKNEDRFIEVDDNRILITVDAELYLLDRNNLYKLLPLLVASLEVGDVSEENISGEN